VQPVGQPAARLADAVRDGRLRAVDVVRAHLDHLAAVEHRLGAFVSTRRRVALDEAEAVDARRDRDRLPLAGVPVAVKDTVEVAGETTRAGSLAAPTAPAEHDFELVARLRDAGAIVIGKTRCPELGIWGTSEDDRGVSVSPWDPTRSAGGSSGGAAAAVAAGVVPLSLASDGLGSIRIPAAACGVVGFKPGRPLLPVTLPGGAAHWHGLTRHGPIATTVEDTSLALDVLVGCDHGTDAEHRRPGRVETIERRLRVAVSVRSPFAGVPVAAPWREAAIEAGRLLHRAGHAVGRADPATDPRDARAVFGRWAQGTAEVVDGLGLDVERLQPRTRAHVELGRRMARHLPVRDADARRWQERVADFFIDHDVLITPTAARTHIPAHRWSQRPHVANVVANSVTYPFTPVWNLADVPAVAIPLWHDRARPLSIQIVAGEGHEQLVLAVARLFESLVPWQRHAPGWQVPAAG
jgi:amidase